jgi:hypothetical protein
VLSIPRLNFIGTCRGGTGKHVDTRKNKTIACLCLSCRHTQEQDDCLSQEQDDCLSVSFQAVRRLLAQHLATTLQQLKKRRHALDAFRVRIEALHHAAADARREGGCGAADAAQGDKVIQRRNKKRDTQMRSLISTRHHDCTRCHRGVEGGDLVGPTTKPNS